MNNSDILAQLTEILEQRKGAAPDTSYVASLYDKGLDAILKKVGEEATETVMAAKDVEQGGNRDKLVYEIADLWFHTMILMADQGLSSDDVLEELARRFGVSGHEEKAARK
ncbi:MAG: phosphoribosyl-ATP diphosphatase [Thiotrichaceae bacterium]|nr:MAG: phosphoribosyl-ATP diphosphatase [Thiotrichaceae bacterium]